MSIDRCAWCSDLVDTDADPSVYFEIDGNDLCICERCQESKFKECDCCGEQKPQLTRCIAYGIETFACAECRSAP